MKRKHAATVVLAAAMALSMAGCGAAASENKPEETQAEESGKTLEKEEASAAKPEEKILVCGSTGYFGQETLDPAYSYDGWYWQFEGVLETMFQLDPSYVPQMVLLDSYEQIDDVTWQFVLKDGLKFHNGNDVTAEAVKKCFEHTLKVSDRAAEQIYFDEITADGKVLTIKTKEPNYTLLNDLCDPIWTVYDAENSDFETTLYGTGAYKLESCELGVEIKLTRFDDYLGGTPKLDKVICKVVSDADALTMALQNGDIDIAAPLPSASIPVFKDKEGFVIDGATSARCCSMNYNLMNDKTGDPAVRQAISLCVDREGICSQIYAGTAVPSYAVFPTTFAYGNTEGLEMTIDSYDTEKAAKILEDAGWVDTDGDGIREKNGEKLSLVLVADSTRKELAQVGDVLASALSEAGAELKINILENSGDAAKNGNFDISLRTFNMAPTGNAQYYLNTRLITGASGNEGGFSNDVFDAFAKQLETTADEKERTDIIKQAVQIIIDERPVDIILHQSFTCVYNDRVKNFSTKPSEYYLIDANIDVE